MRDGSGLHKCQTCDGLFYPKTGTTAAKFASGLGMPDGPMNPGTNMTDPTQTPVDPVPGSDPVGPQVTPFEQFMPPVPTNQSTTKPRQMPGGGTPPPTQPGDGAGVGMNPAANGSDVPPITPPQYPAAPSGGAAQPPPPVQAVRHRAYVMTDIVADILEANAALGERTAFLLAKRVLDEYPLSSTEGTR